MAERSATFTMPEKGSSVNRSKTFVLQSRPIMSMNEYTYRHSKVSVICHNQLKIASSCPSSFRYLSQKPLDESNNPTPKTQPPSISDARNNSETDSSLREDISQLSANASVVYTLTESLEKLFNDKLTGGPQELFSPTSQQSCTFRFGSAGQPICPQVEDSSDNTSREASPFNISDSCSSMSASNSDFSSTEQKDSKPQSRKAKESVSWLLTIANRETLTRSAYQTRIDSLFIMTISSQSPNWLF